MTLIKGQKAIGEYIGYSIASIQRNKDKCSIPYYRAGRNICAVRGSRQVDTGTSREKLE